MTEKNIWVLLLSSLWIVWKLPVTFFYGIRNDGTISDEIRITKGLLSEINWPVCSVTADMNVVLEQETDDGETNSFLSSFCGMRQETTKSWLLSEVFRFLPCVPESLYYFRFRFSRISVFYNRKFLKKSWNCWVCS